MTVSSINPLTESIIRPARSENNSSNTCPAKNDPSLMANPDVMVTLSSETGSETSTTSSQINPLWVVGGIAVGLLTAKMAMKCASQYLKLAPLQTERELAIDRLANYDKQLEQEILSKYPDLAKDPGDGSTLTDRINAQIQLDRMEATSPY